MTIMAEINNLKAKRGIAICAKFPEDELDRFDAFCRAQRKPRSQVMRLAIKRLMAQAAAELKYEVQDFA
jgi:Ribbon-helix-helix protein, copG family